VAIEILVTSQRALNDRPDVAWVRQVLETYSLGAAFLYYTRILHQIELAPDPSQTALQILRSVARKDTVTAVTAEARRIMDRGRRPGVFTPFFLIDILEEAICRCAAPPGPLSAQNRDQLFRAYLATHDHFEDRLMASRLTQEAALKEDILRQVLVGLGDQVALTLPRYWALWVAIPKRLGIENEIARFIPTELPRSMSSIMVPLLSLWAFFGNQARMQNSLPVQLDTQGWNPQVLAAINAVMRVIVLDAATYRQHLEAECAGLRAGERWEYSLVTTSRWPLIQIRESLSCISLGLLANTFGDGLYHRMLTACGGDQTTVNAFTECFGNLFHEYVHDLWHRVVGAGHVHKLTAKSGEELGDGIIAVADGFIVYDAKSRRPTLSVMRSGDLDAFFRDMESGVIKAARQLDTAVKRIRREEPVDLPAGFNRTRVFPIILTLRHFPETPFVYDRIDRLLKTENLLTDDGVAPLLVMDVQSLEVLEGLSEGGADALNILVTKATTPERRTQNLFDLLHAERGGLPWPSRMREAFSVMAECLLNWLRSGHVDESRIDHALYPETPQN
jgi:hypothetical protein